MKFKTNLAAVARRIANAAPSKRVAMIATALGVSTTQVLAEVPAAVTTAISDAGSDLVTVITAVIVAFVAFWGMRKLASKFGWM